MAKDYESFRQLMLDRLSATLPAWQERHAPDLGITIVEVLAYVADYLSYYQDAVATEAYLGSARQRISVRRHARLLDYVLHEGCNARAWVHCQVNDNASFTVDPCQIAFVAAGDQAQRELSVLTEEDLSGLPDDGYELFEPVSGDQIALDPRLNAIAVVGTLKEGATSVTIQLKPGAVLENGAVLILKEVKKPTRIGDKRASYCHALCLTKGASAGNAPTEAVIEWHVDDAIPKPMEGLDVELLGNVVLVDHGRWVTDGELSRAASRTAAHPSLTVEAGQAGPLSRGPLTHRAPLQQAHSAAAMMTQDLREACPQIALKMSGKPWGSVKPDLLESLPTDRHFCVEVDDKGDAWLRFGDGKGVGERPRDKTAVTAKYRIGNGEIGNVPAGAINQIVFRTGKPRSVTVSNPMWAFGGTNPESAATARLVAPGDMRVHQHRAISPQDYVEFARGVPGVSNAAATIVQEGARRVVRVAIDPKGGDIPESDADPSWKALKRRVLERLEPVRRINHDVIVVRPVRVPLTIWLRVTILSSYTEGDIRNQIARKLLSEDGQDKSAFFHPDNLTFGQSIHLSQVASCLHSIPGVASVDCVKFGRADAIAVKTGGRLPVKIDIGPHEIADLSELSEKGLKLHITHTFAQVEP